MGEVIALSRASDSATNRDDALPPWACTLRDGGRTTFSMLGFPNRRVEAWRYSDLAHALDQPLPLIAEAPSPFNVPGVFVARFENGIFDQGGSVLPATGVVALPAVLSDPNSPYAEIIGRINPQADHPLLALNTAQMEQGLVLHVREGETLSAPLHLQFNWSPAQTHPTEGHHIRLVVILEKDASATLIETHTGAPAFSTVVTELRLADGASLIHTRIEQFGAAARHSAVTLGELSHKARYRGFYLSVGGCFARHEALMTLNGEGADAQIDGAYLATDRRHCDNTTVISHAAPNTTSRQAFRGVLGGEARGVYQGCVKVKPEAQGADARQMSRALLLSRKAEIATKPELEIYADDVKCSHGATTGEIDAAALFFLRARGIPEAEARALLVEAFLGEALSALESETLRDLANSVVQDWLARHAGEVSHVD